MAAAGRPHILVIEDTPEDGAMVRQALERAGYAVKLVDSAEAGLVEARRETPQLIVMDVRLPGVDGWEATRRLKSDPLTAPVPVVVLTAVRFTRQKVVASRCDGALQKPVDVEALVGEVRKLTGPVFG